LDLFEKIQENFLFASRDKPALAMEIIEIA
jgi:hypothetical protein